MAYVFDINGNRISPAEATPSAATASTSSAVSVRNTSTRLLASNENRIAATFINDSDETIYLALGSRARMNRGIRLNANGGSYEINQTNLYTGVISAICASGSKNICITEI